MLEIISTVVIFFAILSALVLVHELGHFVMARFFGVHVEEFGIGFPPRAFAIKKGDTLYTINWLPLGGFVKLKGEQGEAQTDPKSFAAKPIWQRLIILGAGVAMNLLLTIVLLSASFAVGTPQALDDAASAPAGTVREWIQITNVFPNTPAHDAGIQAGDTIMGIDDKNFFTVHDVQAYIRSHDRVPVVMHLLRSTQALDITVIPRLLSGSAIIGIGISLERAGIVRYGLLEASMQGIAATGSMALQLVNALWQAVRHLAFDSFVGPVGIATYTATAAKLGFSYLINLIAQLSLSLAVMNFLPIPALDGGRAFFTVIEKFRGRAFEQKVEHAIHGAGFIILIILLVLITVKDISRILIPS